MTETVCRTISSWEELRSLVEEIGDNFPIYWVDGASFRLVGTIRRRIVKRGKNGKLILSSDTGIALNEVALPTGWWYNRFDGDQVFLNFWEAYGYCRRRNWEVAIDNR